MRRRPFWIVHLVALGIAFGLLLPVGISGQAAKDGGQPPADLVSFVQTPSAPCNANGTNELVNAVNQLWAQKNQGVIGVLLGLNTVTFACHLGDNFAQCDVGALSTTELTIVQTQVKGQTVPGDLMSGYAEIMTRCLSAPAAATLTATLPATPPSTETPPLATPTAPATLPASAQTPDCDTQLVNWSLYGLPELTADSALMTYYASLLKCYDRPQDLARCNLPALAKMHLGLRAAQGKPVTPDTFLKNKQTILTCFGYHPLLLQGFGGFVAAIFGVGSRAGGSGGNSGPGNGGSSGGGTSGNGSPQVSETPTEPALSGGPYLVKQTMSLGGETIQGQVCSLSKPFIVNVTTRKVAFVFNFVPADAVHGAWSYAYNIASAGETHSASGTYTVGLPAKDGSLTLSMTGVDNVAFKGFSGPFPVRYQFSLVPSGNVPGC